MEYFAGLDVSMEETHVCVVDRDGKIILEARTPPPSKGPPVERVLFETGRMAPTLFHGLTALGMPVVCVESPPSLPGVEVAGRPQVRSQ